jgi:hypothetical protein
MNERILPLAVAAVNGITLDPERVASLLESSPGHKDHAACGLKRRPCSDCRRTAPLECADPETCGVDSFCRPCAAYWRLKMWEGHPVAKRLPQLLVETVRPDAAAELVSLFRNIVHEAIEQERKMLAAELPKIFVRRA